MDCAFYLLSLNGYLFYFQFCIYVYNTYGYSNIIRERKILKCVENKN